MITKRSKRFFKPGKSLLQLIDFCEVKERQWKIKESIRMQLMDKGIPNQTWGNFRKAPLPKSSQTGTKGLNLELFGKIRQQQPKRGQQENRLTQLCPEKQKRKNK